MKIKRKWIPLAVILGIIVLGWGGIEYTSRPEFCANCHEMNQNYKSWQASTHKNVACMDCHVDPGPVALAERKVAALGELYTHVTGKYEKPIRARVNYQNCLLCHNGSTKNAPDITTTEGPQAASFPHEDVLKEKISCLECHKGVAHGTLPSGDVDQPNK